MSEDEVIAQSESMRDLGEPPTRKLRYGLLIVIAMISVLAVVTVAWLLLLATGLVMYFVRNGGKTKSETLA